MLSFLLIPLIWFFCSWIFSFPKIGQERLLIHYVRGCRKRALMPCSLWLFSVFLLVQRTDQQCTEWSRCLNQRSWPHAQVTSMTPTLSRNLAQRKPKACWACVVVLAINCRSLAEGLRICGVTASSELYSFFKQIYERKVPFMITSHFTTWNSGSPNSCVLIGHVPTFLVFVNEIPHLLSSFFFFLL